MEILASIVGNIVPSVVVEYWNYHREADQHENNLKRKWGLLERQKDDIQTELESKLLQGKIPKRRVMLWLRDVETIKGGIDIRQEPARWRFLARMQKGEFAVKKRKEVEDLHQEGFFPDGLFLDPPKRGEMMPPSTLVGESTAQRKEEILACLLENEVEKIGVYGMGGIGKTTVMKEVNNFLLNESDKFERIIWVTVKEFDLLKLQNDIAYKLNLIPPEFKDEITGAAGLYAALKGRRYVLILDDLWAAFALEQVGIPEPTSANGCKIVLTTRYLDVCLKMGCKNIKLELLLEKEARELFLCKMDKDVFNNPNLKAIAEEVLQKCAQLPLAIVTMAGSFRCLIHDYEWRDALEQLKTSLKGFDGIEEQVHEVLKFSYEQLKEEKLKQCLLRCALYPRDYKIYKEELIEHLIDEGIIERMKSRQTEFDRGYSMLSKLVKACLLEGVNEKYYEGVLEEYNEVGKFVKMHDWVRRMVLQVASPEFMVGHCGLENFSDEKKWREDLVKASLMHKDISTIPSNVSPRCPNLSTLLLQCNKSLKNVPDSLFEHLHGLKVLDLSDTGIESLPNSVFGLENLNILSLGWCRHLKHVSSLAKLTALRKLDLSETGITEVPDGLKMLVNLTYLNLDAKNLTIMPVEILPELSHLQYLRISCHVTVEVEEIERLKKLENVGVRFYDLSEFCTFIRSFEKIAHYQIQVGHSLEDMCREIQDVGKGVILERCKLRRRRGEYLELPKGMQSLEIVECHDLTSLCDVPSLKQVWDLKKIRLSNCKGIKHILSPSFVTNSLQTLEILELKNLVNFRGLFMKEGAASARLPPNTFFHLQVIAIEGCRNIKKLLPARLLLHLHNLKQITVRGCSQVEEIIEASDEIEEEEIEEEGMDTTEITLPSLRLLELWNLPGLKTICGSSKVIICDSLKTIYIYKCPKLKRLPLSLPLLNGKLSPPPSLQHIKGSEEWWESLDSLDTKNVLQPFFHKF